MRIFRKLSKPLTYLILYCCFCCLPAFADFFPVKFSSKAIASPPEAIDVKNFLIQNISGRSQILPLIGRDSDGTISSFKILTLPNTAAGDLYLNNVAVSINQVITPDQAKQLQFEVKNTFTGTATFNFTVTDNEGLTDVSAATYSIPITNNGTLLVCTGGGLGNNILGAKGTFSAPYITPNAIISCINNGLNVAAPAQNLGNAPSPAITSYNYASTSGSLGPEGTYSFLKTLGTIAPTERNCIKTDWVASDHTGDGGYAMIVNGSPKAADFGKTFYQAKTIAVCPNTLYEFSAYVINVLPGSHPAAQAGTEPNISFYINNQLVSTSGAIKYSDASTNFEPQWVKVGGLWYSGPNTSVDLRIDNATFVAGGNDLGLDDISLAICGPDISYPDISLTPKFCSYGVLPLKAEVKASINTYSSYIFQNSTDGGITWSDLGMTKTGSPVYDTVLGTYKYTALYGDIPIDPSMNGYRYRLKVATEAANLTGTTCNISADKIITVSAFDKPVAGTDIVGCNSATTAKVIAAGPGETWSALSGNPAAASIDLSGNISGMISNGIYKFQLINSSGCSDTINVTHDQVANAGTDAYICSPMATYKLADAVTGYKWEKVAGNPADASIDLSTGSISGMIVDGTYHFILRSDYGGCTDEVLVIRSNITLSSTQTNISCFGGSTGAIDLSAAGGTAPYSYSWSNTSTSEDLSGIAAGTYTVTVTDSKSCTATAAITITQPAAALTLSSSQTNINCFGASTGSIDLSAAGGTAPYTYNWSNTSTSEDLSGLTAGTYTVTVTDAKSCTATAAITITQPAAALTLSSSQTNINCFGASTGAIDLSAAGGTAPYTYSWSNTSTSEDLFGLTAGTYTITVTDAKSCTATAAITITQPASALTLSSSQTNINCFGGSTGAIDLSAAGGTTPYTYSWSNLSTNEDLTGIAAGTYTVTVTDSKSCTATATITITQPAAALTLSSSQTNINCFGGSTGAIDLGAAGGTAPYSYSWSNSSTSEDLSGLTAGTYTVTVTDAKSCTATAAITITQPASALTLSSSQTNVNCFGGSTGAIDLSAAGGTAPYTYSWSNSSTSEDLSGLTAGTYTVTVTDAKSCTATAAITITQPASALTLSSSQTNINCFGASTGAIDLSAAGGTAPYSYSWSNSSTNEDLTGIAAGTYTVTVTDAKSCTATAAITITQPASALTLSSSQTNINCFGGSTGAIDLSAAGGTAPYTYSWSNTSTSEDLSGLTAGTYTVIVKDSKGCTATATITITQPASALTLSSSQTNINCFGASTGAIDLGAAGGTAPYTYSWSNSSTNEDLSGLTAGTYTVTVTDSKSCTATAAITITQPASALTLSSSQTNINCFGGSTGAIDLSAAGGTAPYSYSWSNSSTNEDLTGIAAGTYTVTVTDAQSCTATAAITITQPAAALTLSSSQTNINCFGGSTGAIDLGAAGGTAPYSYSWSNSSTSEDLSGLTAGTYTVTVTDAKSCTATAAITISQPASALALSSSQTNINCFGASTGAIDLSAAGGTTPYTYSWSNSSTNEDLTGIAAGTYTVTVTDAKSCTATATITISQPASALALSSSQTNINCFGASTGSIDLSAAGGTAPYSYIWSSGESTEDIRRLTAGTYTVTVTDSKSCTATAAITITQPASALTLSSSQTNINCFGASTGAIDLSAAGGTAPYTYSWNGGQTTEDLSALTAGTYTVTVTDSKSCTVTAAITISQPASALTLSSSQTNINCFGASTGSIDLSAAGGTAPYTYSWSNLSTNEDLTRIAAGTYTVIVTDSKGCTATATITITQPASALTLSSSQTNINCFGASTGAIDLSAAGGTAPYTYSWSNSSTSEDLSGIAAGTYTVTVTDSKSCTATAAITITQPASALTLSSSQTNINCFGASTGAIDLSAAGGTAPYTYSWNGGQTTEDLSALTAGTYTVTVTDSRGCNIQRTFTVREPEALSVLLTVKNATCSNTTNGNITSLISGGKAPYKIIWNKDPTLSSPDLMNVLAGKYEILVTDANGCSITAKSEILHNNCGPVAMDDDFKVAEGITLTADVSPNDKDPHNENLSFIKLSDPPHGKIFFNKDGKFLFQPDNGFFGLTAFSYQICNVTGLCHTAKVTITVAEFAVVNLTPELSSVREGRKVNISARLLKPFKEDVTITVAYSGQAEKEKDYLVLDNYQSLTIPKGQISTTQKITIAALTDDFQEGDEDIIMKIKTVSNPDVYIGNGAVVIINDIYPAPPIADESKGQPDNKNLTIDPLLSPNGDGIGNDFFRIGNIEMYADNEVLIFNRWGNELFYQKAYNNADKAFKGYANKGLLVSSDIPLPDGVYFYIVNTYRAEGAERIKNTNKGYLILRR